MRVGMARIYAQYRWHVERTVCTTEDTMESRISTTNTF